MQGFLGWTRREPARLYNLLSTADRDDLTTPASPGLPSRTFHHAGHRRVCTASTTRRVAEREGKRPCRTCWPDGIRGDGYTAEDRDGALRVWVEAYNAELAAKQATSEAAGPFRVYMIMVRMLMVIPA